MGRKILINRDVEAVFCLLLSMRYVLCILLFLRMFFLWDMGFFFLTFFLPFLLFFELVLAFLQKELCQFGRLLLNTELGHFFLDLALYSSRVSRSHFYFFGWLWCEIGTFASCLLLQLLLYVVEFSHLCLLLPHPCCFTWLYCFLGFLCQSGCFDSLLHCNCSLMVSRFSFLETQSHSNSGRRLWPISRMD